MLAHGEGVCGGGTVGSLDSWRGGVLSMPLFLQMTTNLNEEIGRSKIENGREVKDDRRGKGVHVTCWLRS